MTQNTGDPQFSLGSQSYIAWETELRPALGLALEPGSRGQHLGPLLGAIRYAPVE
jgi:hypothetical protein